jgi:ADP-heptose:LPS heptosyltransferase
MAFFSGAPLRVGFPLRGRSWAYNLIAKPASPPLSSGRRPVTEAYLDQVRALGLSPEGPYRTSLFVTEEERSHARKILARADLKPGERMAVLAPGASWPAKRWPLERFRELGFRLKAEGIRPLFIFGPQESGLAEEFEEHMDKDWLYINQPSLRGLMAFIEAADVLVSNDAGPLHVGPALGTPTLGIFGPGEPAIWFPYGPPHQRAYAEIPCGHCGLDHCPWLTCMDRVEPRDLMEPLLRMARLKVR